MAFNHNSMVGMFMENEKENILQTIASYEVIFNPTKITSLKVGKLGVTFSLGKNHFLPFRQREAKYKKIIFNCDVINHNITLN